MKYLHYLFIFSSALFYSSCSKEEGCLDQRATNYEETYDKACTDCCIYGNDTIFVSSSDTLYSNDTLYISSSDTIYIGNGYNPQNLIDFQQDIVGSWEGIATSPWIAPYTVEMEFFANGTYSASCTDGSTVAFYYGTDADNPAKVYELNTVDYFNNQLVATGTIDIYFNVGSINTGDLEELRFSDQADSLFFNFYHQGQYGPIEYELNRQ